MLILSLLLVLCAVIALSYYENIEYFTNPTIGNTVTCTANGPKPAGTLYQMAKNNKLNFYADLNTAKQWDPLGASNAKTIADCTGYTLGTEMKTPGPDTKYGITAKCATNPPGDKPVDTYFQYSINQTLMPYLNKDTADRLSGYDTMGKPLDPFIINDCSGFSLGNLIGSNLPAPSTTVGQASGSQGSYGTLNTPDAQIGTPTGLIHNPVISNTPLPATYGTTGNGQITPPVINNTPLSRPLQNWIRQLGPLLSASNSAQSSHSLSAPAQPVRNDVNPQVSVSNTGYDAMKLQNQSALLGNIKKIVQDELRTSRVQPENHPLALSGTSGSCSNSTQQGSEYMNGKEDMSKYIKKDSIPCWGCSLDY